MINNKTLLIAFCAATILTGCQEERVNPLLSKEKWEVTDWMYDNLTTEVEDCAKHWEDPRNAPPRNLKECEDVAQKLANEMNYQGFSQHVRAVDLDLPLYWKFVNERTEMRDKSKEDARKNHEKAKTLLRGLDSLE